MTIDELVSSMNQALKAGDMAAFERYDNEHRILCNKRNTEECAKRTKRTDLRDYTNEYEGVALKQLYRHRYMLKKQLERQQEFVDALSVSLVDKQKNLKLLEAKKAVLAKCIREKEEAESAQNLPTKAKDALPSDGNGGQLQSLPTLRQAKEQTLSNPGARRERPALSARATGRSTNKS